MAVPAKRPDFQSLPQPTKTSPADQKQLTQLQHICVRLYAGGKSRKVVAEMVGTYAFPQFKRVGALRAMRAKLRDWEETQWFRDAVYDYSIQQMDLAAPKILNGVARRAKRGRVDAARLALEVTGRHNPRGEAAAPAVVNLNLGGIPRPASRALPEPDIEIEAIEEE